MITLHIIESAGSDLYRKLKQAMRSGELRTFSLASRGRKVVHQRYPGWMNWSHAEGVITCEVLSPRKPGAEWQLMSAFLGRLADRFSTGIEMISIRFPRSGDRRKVRGRRKTSRRRRR